MSTVVSGPPAESELVLEHVAVKKSLRISGPVSLSWRQGEDELRLNLFCDDAADVFLARCPAETATRQVEMIAVRRTGMRARFVAVLTPVSVGEDLRVSVDGDVVRMRRGDVEDVVTLGPVLSSEPATDARFSLVRLVSGRPSLGVLVQGSALRWRDRVLIEGPVRGWAQKTIAPEP